MRVLDPINNAFNMKLTPILKRLFGDDIIEQIKAVGLKARDVFELIEPQAQCKAIIGSSVGKDCWICGLPIQAKIKGFKVKSKGPGTDIKSGVTAECEHVLPIAQAAILLNLYNSKLRNELTKQAFIKESLDHEYAWAHVVCNQEKNDICPILVKSDGTFEISKEQIKYLLNKIQKSTRTDSILIKKMIRDKYSKSFIDVRAPIIFKRYDAILKFIQRINSPDELPRFSQLVVFAGIAGLTDKSIINSALYPIIGGELEKVNANMASIQPLEIVDKNESEVIINAFASIRDKINHAIHAQWEGSQESKQLWADINAAYNKYTYYLVGNADESVEDTYTTNLFDYLIYLNKMYPEAITKEANITNISLFIYIKMLNEMLEQMEDSTQIEFISNIIDEYRKFIDKSLYDRLDSDYKAYETKNIEYAASILTRLKSTHKSRMRSHLKTLKSKYTATQQRRFTQKRAKKHNVIVPVNETIERKKHTMRSGRGATRFS
jgi:hypothetical protein